MFYDDTTPIAALTVADLKALIAGLNTEKPRQPEQKTARYVYGLQGIRDIFGSLTHNFSDYFTREASSLFFLSNKIRIFVAIFSYFRYEAYNKPL